MKGERKRCLKRLNINRKIQNTEERDRERDARRVLRCHVPPSLTERRQTE